MGVAHPDILLEGLTSYQLAEWEAFDQIDPIGDRRADQRIAYLAWIVTNLAIAMVPKKRGAPSKFANLSDFELKWGKDKMREKGDQSIEDMKALLYAIAGKGTNGG